MAFHPGLSRTTTTSTTSTTYSPGLGSTVTSFSSVPLSSRSSFKPPSPGSASQSGLTVKNSTDRDAASFTGMGPQVRDLDQWGYLYSLRVAALQQRLKSSAGTPGQPNAPFLPPQTPPTSPIASRFSVSSASSRMTAVPADQLHNEADKTIKRKKSGLRISISGGKGDVKFPKDFLLEFWGRLSVEEGDSNGAWRQAVHNFLLLVQKRGTKTAQANMREIAALLQTFGTCLPPVGPTSVSHEEHRAHLIRVLYEFLPESTYFATSKSDKDKNLLLRLRSELQGLMLQSPTNHEAEFSPILQMNGVAAKAATGNRSSQSGLSPLNGRSSFSAHSPSSPHNPHSFESPSGPHPARPSSSQVHQVQRKPSPQWEGVETETPNADLFDVVGMLWGVPRYALEGDLEIFQQSGSLEKLYLHDLKTRLTVLARSNEPSAKVRQAALSGTLASLLASFPDLIRPGSPGTGFAQAAETPSQTFFTPPRKSAVFAHMVRRAAEGGNTIRAAALLEHCQSIWDVESQAEKERQVETLYRRWTATAGTPEEAVWVDQLAEAVGDLALILSPSEPPTRILEHIRAQFISDLADSLRSIFPTTSLPPPPVPLALIPVLNAAPSVFLRSKQSTSTLSDLADDLRAAAVGEYVMAASEMGIHQYQLGTRTGESGKDAVVEGFEKLAGWIDSEVCNIRKVWGQGLGPALDPASIVIQKQLPLFLAEIQVLETATGSSSSEVFVLYEVTSRLLALWDQLCPGVDHAFDLDGFFEPHVVTWLRETEVNETHQWVARTIGMDQWIPEGDGRYSQSVTDLFEFIRSSTQLVRDLPLSEYKRAVFLIDMAKTASIAVTEYSKSVHMLFQAELSPPRTTTKESAMPSLSMGGKAGAWLAKGRHAVQKVEQKLVTNKADGFLIPTAALVKLTNIGAAKASLEDVGYFMEADQCARVIRERRLSRTFEKPDSQRFTVTVMRGQNLLTRSGKPADALVTVIDKDSGERLFKSRTVLESEDPRWEQTFELQVGAQKILTLDALDRQLVGKHEPIGSRTFKLDPSMFVDMPVRDVVLPLSPRGLVHLRVSLDTSSVYDVAYHLASASRHLENTATDMVLEIVDRMAEFASAHLSRNKLHLVTKPLRDRKRGHVTLTDVEIDNSLALLFDYLDANFALFHSTLTDETRLTVMLALWRRTVDILISLLIPPLSDRPASNVMLAPPEVDLVFKWLQQLKAFFNAAENGVEHGVPCSQLQVGGYKDMLLIGQYLDLPTPALRERATAAVHAASSVVSSSPVDRMRTLNINGGTGSARGRVDEDNERMAEVMLRILRMRPDTSDFLQAQLAILLKSKVDRQRGIL